MSDAGGKGFIQMAPGAGRMGVAVGIIVLSVMLLVWRISHFSGPIWRENQGGYTDFDDFYLVGRMYWSGMLNDAYVLKTMWATQVALTNANSVMPWTYPPQFDAFVAAFAMVPKGLAYTAFVGGTLLSYLLVLRRVAGKVFTEALALTAPAIWVAVLCGQNGLFTGTLIGLFCLAFLSGRRVAGVPLGLMVIKPHLAIGLSVLSLASRRWSLLAIAAPVVGVTSLLSTWAFGIAIWGAFLGAIKEAGGLLASGGYPYFRMTSIYAALFTLGLPAKGALSVQFASAVLACAVVVYIALSGRDLRRALGVAVLATLVVSPYCYDYDMTIFGIAAALLLPDVLVRARGFEKLAMLVLAWLSSGWGLLRLMSLPRGADDVILVDTREVLSFAAFGYLALIVMVAVVLKRAPLAQSLRQGASAGAVRA